MSSDKDQEIKERYFVAVCYWSAMHILIHLLKLSSLMWNCTGEYGTVRYSARKVEKSVSSKLEVSSLAV